MILLKFIYLYLSQQSLKLYQYEMLPFFSTSMKNLLSGDIMIKAIAKLGFGAQTVPSSSGKEQNRLLVENGNVNTWSGRVAGYRICLGLR